MAIRTINPLLVYASALVLGWAIAGFAAAQREAADSPRGVVSLNSDWRFTKDDPPGTGDKLRYAKLKGSMLEAANCRMTNDECRMTKFSGVGGDVAHTQPEFEDSGWRKLDLPHDWGIEGPFKQEIRGENGKLPYWGVAWYRKRFDIPAEDAGKQFYLDIDGAMSFANVWINGKYVGGWPYGYTSWRVDLTPFINVGGINVLAIRLDNPADSSRWYPGGGIYRNVWLTKTAPVHVGQWGTRITTPDASEDDATVNVEVTVENRSAKNVRVNVEVEIHELGADGEAVGVAAAKTETVPLQIESAGKAGLASLSAKVTNPKLWSPDKPNRYVAVTTLRQGEEIVDRVETKFGIRTFEFTTDDGFHLNGKRMPIRGVCLHHDLGALGAAFNLRARERHLEMLKEMGCNAIRPSHNPPEPELLDLCDRMGFLVMVEAFDAWQMEKRENDYHKLFDDWHALDLRAMIRRDRNHPSVILWSLGNEVYEQREGKNWPLAKQLADIVHEEDSTRPVNMALHVVEASTNGFQNAVDVFGYNYTPFGYAQFRKDNPEIPLVGSETSSCTSTRGEYFFPVNEEDKRSGRVNFQVTSYDYSAPKWAMAPDIEFKGQDENPFVAGEFVWTGFDYLGEPTPYNEDVTGTLDEGNLKYMFTDPELEAQAKRDIKEFGKIRAPSRSSYFGILDLCGFRKDRFYIYQARWRPELPMAHILPHWNWPERVGQVTPVHVYTSGDEGELFLNGQSLGRKKKGEFEYRLRWNDVVYERGELRVVTYRDGKEWATDVMKTTGRPARVVLEVDRNKIRGDGKDLAFVTAKIVDADGLVVPRSKNLVLFQVGGPGEIVVTDNGDPTSHEPFQQSHRAAFNGMCLAIVRAKAGESGAIAIRASSERLADSETHITAESFD